MTQDEVDAVVATMRDSHGLDVSCYDSVFVARCAEKRRHVAAGESHVAFLARLAADPGEADAFYRSLRVVYSEFFRAPVPFALLEQVVLPSLLDARARSGGGEVRVWSAGCAAGQEAWSVAMLLDELIAQRGGRLGYRIFATDLSESDLAVAREAAYSAASLGNVKLRHVERCFSRRGAGYEVVDRLRARVEFSVYDLLDPETVCPPNCIFGEFDLVLCNNVLLYYGPAAQRLILEKLHRSLAGGGYLLTDPTERQIVEGGHGFRHVTVLAPLFRRISAPREA